MLVRLAVFSQNAGKVINERAEMEKIIETESEKFVIRAYRDADDEGVRKLWKAVFEKEMPPLLWRWKYLDNPYRRHILLCVNETGEIVVSYSGIPYRTNYLGKTVEMTQLMDIMSHPDYRKTGLFIKTAQAYFEIYGKSILFVYGFPGKYHLGIGEKYLGYEALTKPVAYLSAQTDVLACNKTGSGKVERVGAVDASFNRIWERCEKDYPLSIIRNSAFVRWRFLQHPMEQYEIFAYRKDSELVAYAVFALKGKIARMVDILAPPSEELITVFLNQTAQLLKNAGTEQVDTWLPENHFIAKSLVSADFIISAEPLGITATVRNFDKSPLSEWTSEHLFYTMADADLF
jgi:predicted acetyltransferase